MLEVSYFSEAGRKGVNQDAILALVDDPDAQLLAIADGVGGKSHGETASRVALSSVKDIFLQNKNAQIDEIFSHVHKDFKLKAAESEQYIHMATTLTLCIFFKGKVKIGHVGDCRVYHLRNDGIITRTKDQTELQKLLDEKIITKSRAKIYQRKNVLLSSISTDSEYELQKNTFGVESNDRIIMISDGAYSSLSKSEIKDISISSNSVPDFSLKLKQKIEKKPIKDDYSAIIIQIK